MTTEDPSSIPRFNEIIEDERIRDRIREMSDMIYGGIRNQRIQSKAVKNYNAALDERLRIARERKAQEADNS